MSDKTYHFHLFPKSSDCWCFTFLMVIVVCLMMVILGLNKGLPWQSPVEATSTLEKD